MDFNRYSVPLRRRNLPEDAPALYEDEIKAYAAWLPESRSSLSVPDDYPLTHELFLILDSLDDISNSRADPDCADLLLETLRQAREQIWSNERHPLRRPQDRHVALYLAGKVAETYVKLDAEDSMDRLLSFLDYVQTHVGVLPMACFHALAARAGIARRYHAVLKICQVAQSHHGGKADAELLHLRLRALVAQSEDVDLTRHWDTFTQAGVSAPRKTFDLLLRTHVRRQDVSQLNQVLEAMPTHGHEVDARAWLTILRGFQSFRPTLATMLRRDAKIVQSPTLNVVNQLLLLLSKELDVDGALMVLRIFRIPSVELGAQRGSFDDAQASIIKGPSPQPNAQTYAVMTQMFGRLGRQKEALALYRLAVSAATDQDGGVLQQASSHVMRAYLNEDHPVRAMSFAAEVLGLPYFGSAETKTSPSIDFKLPSWPKIKIEATTAHYRILLECASALDMPDAARRIVVHLLQNGHQVDQQVLRGLARLIFSTIDQDALESIRVIRQLLPGHRRQSKRKQRLESLLDLLRHLGASERIVLASQHAKDLFRDTGFVPSKTEATHSEPAKDTASSTDELRQWLMQDTSSLFKGIAPTSSTTFSNAALSQDLSRPLSPAAYAMRIRVYAVVRRDYEAAQQVYHAMLAHGVQPNMMHIAPLVEGLCAVGKLAEAQQLKQNARKVTGFEPTLRIHTALVRAYVHSGYMDAARAELKELTERYEIDDTIANIIEAAQSGRRSFSLIDRPVGTDSKTLATRFHSLMRLRRYLAAQELLQEALDAGMKADNVVHDLVRRSVSYVRKELSRATGLLPASKAGKVAHRQEESSSHVFELAQAVRLAEINRERITKSMAKHSEMKRKTMKERRKKVVGLILDFADGKLDEVARKSKA